MNQIKSLIYVMYPEVLKSLIIFWSIMAAILASGYVIATLSSTTEVFLIMWPFFLVWLSITSFQLVKTDFHYALKLGATRNQFLGACLVLLILVILIGEGIHLLYLNLFPEISSLFGLQSVTLVHWGIVLPELSTGLVLGYDLILGLLFSTMFFAIASIKHQYGKLPVFVFLGVLAVLILIPRVQQAILDWGISLYNGENVLTVFWVALPAFIALLISRTILLRASLR